MNNNAKTMNHIFKHLQEVMKKATRRTTNLFSVWSILGILHTNTVQGQGNQKKKKKI